MLSIAIPVCCPWSSLAVYSRRCLQYRTALNQSCDIINNRAPHQLVDMHFIAVEVSL